MMTPCKLVDISPLTRVKWPNFLTGYVPTTTILTLSCNGWTLLGSKIWALWARQNFPTHLPTTIFPEKFVHGHLKKKLIQFLVSSFPSSESPKISCRTYDFQFHVEFFFLKAVIHHRTHIFQPSWAIGRCETKEVHRLALRCFSLLRLWLSPPNDALLTIIINPLDRKINIELSSLNKQQFSPKVSGIQNEGVTKNPERTLYFFRLFWGGWVGFPYDFLVEIWWNHEGARLTGDQYLTHHLDGCFGTNLEGKGWGNTKDFRYLKWRYESTKEPDFRLFLGLGLGPLEKPYPYSWKKSSMLGTLNVWWTISSSGRH